MKLLAGYKIPVAVLLIGISVLPAGARHSRRLPWAVGEKLTFSVRWGIIRAGVATLEVRERLKLGGRDTFRIVHTARSARFFDPFYRVRNRAESYIDAQQLHTMRFERIIREGGYSKDSVIIYDHEYEAAYEDGERFEIPEGVQDILSAFYYLRTMELTEGQTYEFEVGSDKKIWPLRVKFLGRERVSVPAGEFDTIVVQPLMREEESLFKQEGDLVIWLTDDERRIPVLARSKIKVGSISVHLTEKKLPRLK